jgi:hypothetical protein
MFWRFRGVGLRLYRQQQVLRVLLKVLAHVAVGLEVALLRLRLSLRRIYPSTAAW